MDRVEHDMNHNFDVIVIGAGLSGVGAACHMHRALAHLKVGILESRSQSGGTWDLFKYPGIRSDSDMHTLGYDFKPWVAKKAIADGHSILEYIRQTIEEYQLNDKIIYNQKVKHIDWDSQKALWHIHTQDNTYSAKFVYSCTGYYDYTQAYTPQFEGKDNFNGQWVHPQFWPQDFDYSGKRIVVIGSGATAVTLVPTLAQKAQSLVMLQRSPTYIISQPDVNQLALVLQRWFPATWAYGLTRWLNISKQSIVYHLCQWFPRLLKEKLVGWVALQLPKGYEVEKHFSPTYNPWDQRLCLVPNGDLFESIRSGKVEIVTDYIQRFDATGIVLKSGQHISADIVVMATGLEMLPLGGFDVSIDGQALEVSEQLMYKGMMSSNVPNLAIATGYTNASWTLKCDLCCRYFCRLLKFMQRRQYDYFIPVNADQNMRTTPLIDLNSGYVKRAIDKFPKQGDRPPWKLRQNYLRDYWSLKYGLLKDGVMQFGKCD